MKRLFLTTLLLSQCMNDIGGWMDTWDGSKFIRRELTKFRTTFSFIFNILFVFSVSSKNNNKSISKFSFLVNLLCHGCSFYNFTLVTKSQEMITTRAHELLATEQSNALPGLRAWSGLMLMMMIQQERRDWLYLIHMLLSSHTFADSRTQTLV